MATTAILLTESDRGPAERLLDVILSSSAHLWHNRPGVDDGGVWKPAKRRDRARGAATQPGLFVPAAVDLYSKLVDIYQLNGDLMAHFASYAVLETEWRDLKVACAALMLVQPFAGQPVHGDAGAVEFSEDDYRAVGQGMLLFYQQKSKRMMTPKSVLRVAQLLETAEIAVLNRKGAKMLDHLRVDVLVGKQRKLERLHRENLRSRPLSCAFRRSASRPRRPRFSLLVPHTESQRRSLRLVRGGTSVESPPGTLRWPITRG